MNEIDLNNLENNEPDDLKEYATEELGLTLRSNAGKETIIAKIREALGADPVDPVDPVTQQEDDAVLADEFEESGEYDPNLKKGIPPLHSRRDIKKFRIEIPEVDGDSGSTDVTVGVQGKTYLLKRGVEITVPEFIIGALNDAIETRHREVEINGQRVNQERRVPSYPFRVIGPA
jgi:hypothetical protein